MRHIDHRKCCQLSSADNRRQFITLSDQLCVQHDGRDDEASRWFVCGNQLLLTLPVKYAERGLYNGRASVRLSVCLSH